MVSFAAAHSSWSEAELRPACLLDLEAQLLQDSVGADRGEGHHETADAAEEERQRRA